MSGSPYDKWPTLDVDLSLMTEEEVHQFESVLNRNDVVNMMEINRIRRLKSSISVPQQSTSSPNYPQHSFKRLVCQKCNSLCLSPSVVVNKSSINVSCVCRVCRTILCRTCWGTPPENRLKICFSCYQRIVLDAKTGNWFHKEMKKRLSIQSSFQHEYISPELHPETIQSRHSPKKNILRRLRSYNSVHEELDCDDTLEVHLKNSRNNGSVDEQSLNQSLFLNSDDDQGKCEVWNVNSNKNYYQPLSHINNNPLKSSSNGSPIAIEEADLDRWKGVVTDNILEDAIQPLSSEPGEVLVELDFNFRMSQFIVILRQCRNLPIADLCTKSICPYLFILLLPDRSKKSRRTTSVKKNCCTPLYDQIFKYSINFTELESRSLLIMLCHKDDHSTRDLALGQAVISLSFIDFNKPLVKWYSFQSLNQGNATQPRQERSLSNVQLKRSNIPPYFGEISLALKYVPRQFISVTTLSQTDSAGELHVWVKSMRNIAPHQWISSPTVSSDRRLSAMDPKTADYTPIMNGLHFSSSRILDAVTQLGQNPPVARVCLLPYRTNIQSTSPARHQEDNGVQFVWSSILKFPNVDLEELRTRSMEVTVWVNSRHGWLNKIIESKCMGGVRLSKGSSSPEFCAAPPRGVSTGLIEEKMWNAMLERCNTWVDGTLKLKMESSFLTQTGMQ